MKRSVDIEAYEAFGKHIQELATAVAADDFDGQLLATDGAINALELARTALVGGSERIFN